MAKVVSLLPLALDIFSPDTPDFSGNGSISPIFETAGYARLWAVTTQSSGDITGSAETDTGYYAVKWWDDAVDIYDSGDPFSKAAIGNLQAFEVYPCDIAGVPEGQFDGFDLSDNSLTQVRSEGVTLVSSGGALTGGYYYYGYWLSGPYFSPAIIENGIISDNLLSAEALDQFYTDLDAGTGSLFVDGNFGIDADDPTIATAKGYTVIGSEPPNTSLLLNFNGTNGSTNFIDSSPNEFVVTASGGAQISTAQSKFGGAGGLFDGVNSALTINPSTAFEFGLSDFTIELWLYQNSTPNGSAVIAEQYTGGNNKVEFTIGFCNGNAGSAGGGIPFFGRFNGSNWSGGVASTALANAQWHHIAAVRRRNIWTLYINGTSEASFTSSDFVSQDNLILIGRRWDTPLGAFPFFNGYLDDVRLVKGKALYTANFTPPTHELEVYP
jgi:hypothetical protein